MQVQVGVGQVRGCTTAGKCRPGITVLGLSQSSGSSQFYASAFPHELSCKSYLQRACDPVESNLERALQTGGLPYLQWPKGSGPKGPGGSRPGGIG